MYSCYILQVTLDVFIILISPSVGTTIPCEFCQSQIALINLSEHQQNCGVSKVGASVSEPSDETIAIPCDNCGEQFPQSSVIFHQVFTTF